MSSEESKNLGQPGSFRALTYLSLFGLGTTAPLVLLLGALLLQSASVQRAQLEGRTLQVLDALVNDIDRDLDRDITILHTLETSDALASADWHTFYNQAKAGLQGRATWCWSTAMAANWLTLMYHTGNSPPRRAIRKPCAACYRRKRR
jgi:hypothetical protein